MKPGRYLVVIVEFNALDCFQLDHGVHQLPEVVAETCVEVGDAGSVLFTGFEQAVAFNRNKTVPASETWVSIAQLKRNLIW